MMPSSSMPAVRVLAETALSVHVSQEVARACAQRIRDDLLERSAHLRAADFRSIHVQDLAFLFRAYDDQFFAGFCSKALDGRPLTFRLAQRMTRTAGMTKRITTSAGAVKFEIAVATSMLFDSFGDGDRTVDVCGVTVGTRLEALQRIFEHELVHLVELLCWQSSDCAAGRFQDIAARFFGHQAHTHALITRRERAATSGILVGTRVTFVFEGRQIMGRVNRITKRATVLVEDPEGVKYSDGLRYKTYYVPLGALRPLTPPS